MTITDNSTSLIDSKAYLDNTEIESVSFPNVSLVGDHGFAGCINLKMAYLPRVTLIGDHSFAGCTNLEEITLSSSVLIGSDSFEGCNNLTKINYIDIGEDPENLICGNIYTFKDFSSLKEIHLSKTLKEVVEKVGEDAVRLGAAEATIYYDLDTMEKKEAFEHELEDDHQ